MSALHHENITYSHNGVELEGTLVNDGQIRNRRPGVIVCHAWMGLDAYTRRRATQIARLGYNVFALDMYGKDVLAQDAEAAGKLMNPIRADRNLMRERAQTAIKVLRGHRLTEGRNIAAVGYCFGGGVALELARAGSDLSGVVSFHGLLDADPKTPAKKITAKVLALHGSEDPMVPPKQVAAFQDEMVAAKADWQFVSYGNAMHGFSNPDAANPKMGIEYNQLADQRSWEAMTSFLAEIFQD
jgi:dienelactone hydrolase